jgi:large repetitive protein
LGSCVLDSLILEVTVSSTLPPINFPNDTTFCDANGTLFLDATTTGATSYIWNIPNTGPTYTVTSPGTYSVTATDIYNCNTSASVTVDYVNLTLTSSSTNETCMGWNDGSATVTPSGGYTPYTYLWNTTPPGSTSTVTGLPAGTYSVTVTEDNGCSATASVTVTAGGVLSIIEDSSAVSCYGYTDGSASVNVSGGISPYTYAWSTTPQQTTQTATGLSAGTYIVTITDDNGCAGTASVTIDTPTEVTATIPTVSPAACTGVSGSMTVAGAGGTPPYIYSWNTIPPQTSITASGLPAGIYTVTVTDNNGCSGTATAEYTTISLSFTHEPEYCDQQNGEATVSVDQYSGNYTITWNNSSSNPTISGLSSGTYTVTVTDDNGSCTMSVNIPEVQGPIASFTMNPNPATMGEDIVSFHNQSMGGTQWHWDFGDNSFSNQEDPEHTYYDSGTYTVWLIVTDAHNCSDSTSQTILIHDVFTFYIPNAFSPNGDGVNDVFMPYGLNTQPDGYSMSIFDRWGGIVYYTTSMNSPWDGTVDGKIDTEHVNVYTYKITFRDSKGLDHEVNGIVTIVY